jgi:8-oxo-dGTP pyrophosphatase MutT (NUDIX family)
MDSGGRSAEPGGAAGAGGWRNLGEEPLVETPWFRLRRARVELPGGRRLDHYLIRLPPLTMTAMLDQRDRVLLLWRHRFIPDNRGWELPSGIAEMGADPADGAGLAATASRQALAETGWEAIGPRPLLVLQQNGGLTDSAVHVFVTRQAVHRGPPEADFEAERIEWVPLADAAALVAGGQVRDASTAAALLWLSGPGAVALPG